MSESKSKAVKKKCPAPGCGKFDVTDFSTCRHCGHRYSEKSAWNKPEDKSAAIGNFLRDPVQVLLALIVCGAVYYGATKKNPEDVLGDTVSEIVKSEQRAEHRVIRHESKILRRFPYDVDARVKRADAYQTLLNSRAALEDYTIAIDHRPRAEYYKKRALAFDALGEYEKANHDREEARRLER